MNSMAKPCSSNARNRRLMLVRRCCPSTTSGCTSVFDVTRNIRDPEK